MDMPKGSKVVVVYAVPTVPIPASLSKLLALVPFSIKKKIVVVTISFLHFLVRGLYCA